MTEVVAALIWDNGKFMICQRPAHKARGLLWEFVGGKVEPGETGKEALVRECREELGVTVDVGDVFMTVIHTYPDITVHLTLYHATVKDGTPTLLEHNDLRWITPSEISNYDFCPADEEILKHIREVYDTPQNAPVGGVYAPPYYREFTCIADRCRHSCCIDWEICIDEATYKKYKRMKDILATVENGEDGPRFAMCADGRCPHLNGDGLCDIIIVHGEDCLSEICRNHPRFYNRVGGRRIEVGLGIVCEEACRLILENDRPFTLSRVEDLLPCAPSNGGAFDALPARNRIIAIIESDGGYDDKIAALQAASGIPIRPSPEAWLDRFLALEILDPTWEKDLRAMREEPPRTGKGTIEGYDTYYARLLGYFVYRHVSVAADAADLGARLAFCILSTDMIKWLFERGDEHTPEALMNWARRYSAEIEYSEDNTAELIFACACMIL